MIFFMSYIINEFKGNVIEKMANIPIGTLRRGRRALNERFDHNSFSWDEICDRYAPLMKRYKTFKALIRVSGVFWDQLTNVVHANDEIWSSICEVRF